MTTPPDPPSSAGPTPDEVSSRSRPAADPALTPTQSAPPSAPPSAPHQALRYRLLACDDRADPSEWDRRAYAAQVATALDSTESLADAFMAGDLSMLDQALAPTFCWWSMPRPSGDGAPTGMPRPLEPLATRSTFLALARRWRQAFGDLVISLGPSLIETEDRLLRQPNPRAPTPAGPHTPLAGDAHDARDAQPVARVPVATLSVAQPRRARRPAPRAIAADDHAPACEQACESAHAQARLSAIVTVGWSATARHTGPLGRFPATGASVRLAGVAHLRFDAIGQVTHFAAMCDTPFWKQLPGLASFAIGPLTAPASARDRRLVNKSHPIVAPLH